MKPYQEIEKAKMEANDDVMKLQPMIQGIVNAYIEKTGGSIAGIHVGFTNVTTIGSPLPEVIITRVKFDFL
jgi:hypothetical protein